MSVILDGTGNGFKAEVDKNKRLHTRSVSTNDFDNDISNGNGYQTTTNLLTLTSDGESALLYLKNNSDNDIRLEKSIIQIGDSTGGANSDVVTKSYLNPTGGTIISDANDAVTINLNLSSVNTFEGDKFKGGEGKTVVSANFSEDIFSSPGRYILESHVLIPKGASIAITATPPTGNTSMKILFQTFFHELKD